MTTYGSVYCEELRLQAGVTPAALDAALRPLLDEVVGHRNDTVGHSAGDVAEAVLGRIWGGRLIPGDDGTVASIDVTGDTGSVENGWYSYMDELPGLIAPMVAAGQTLRYIIEEGDGERFRYLFDGMGVEIQQPRLVWPGQAGYEQAED